MSEKLTPERIAAIRERCEKASLNWKAEEGWDGADLRLFLVRGARDGIKFGRDAQAWDDVRFAAHARTDIPDLLAEAERQAEEIAGAMSLMREHGFGANSDSLDDALRQVIQAAISASSNVEALIIKMEQQAGEIERARTYTGFEAYGCPLCVYREGVLTQRCTMHAQIDFQAKEIADLQECALDDDSLITALMDLSGTRDCHGWPEAIDRIKVKIAGLKADLHEAHKCANCGGPPTGKTCSVDGHAIYGPFFSDDLAGANAICEFHAFEQRAKKAEAERDRLRADNEDLRIERKQLQDTSAMLSNRLFEIGQERDGLRAKLEALPGKIAETLCESCLKSTGALCRVLVAEAAAPPATSPQSPKFCPDCAEAMKIAYSDATTPGFFSPYCPKHQQSSVSAAAPPAGGEGGKEK